MTQPQSSEQSHRDAAIACTVDGLLFNTTQIIRLSDKPGFVTSPEGFQVHANELNRDHWTEGFVVTP